MALGDLSVRRMNQINSPKRVSQRESAPEDLKPAIKALEESLDEAHWKCGRITEVICYALIHPEDKGKADDAVAHQQALLNLKAIVGPIASEVFNQHLRIQTPPAFFHAGQWLYKEGMTVQASSVFRDLLDIGRAHEERLPEPPLQWARDLTVELIRSQEQRIKMWVRAVCDPPDYSTDLNWDDPDEIVMGPTWCAPQLIVMRPSRNAPYDPAKLWDRADRETTKSWLKTFAELFTIHVQARIDDLAKDETVKLAKQPKPVPAANPSAAADFQSQKAGSPKAAPSVKKAYRKLSNDERNRKIVAEFRKLERRKPNMTGVWYSEQLAKMQVAAGLTAETIRKITRS